MHLSGETEASNVIAPQSRDFQSARNGNRASRPPIVRLLLCPTNLRGNKRSMLFGCRGNHMPVLIDNEDTRSASSDVNP